MMSEFNNFFNLRLRDGQDNTGGKRFSLFQFRLGIFYLIFFVWLVLWIFQLTLTIKNVAYYRFALKSSLSDIHRYHATFDKDTWDYYDILRYCDRILPAGASLRLILPTTSKYKYAFLREKGRYFLYPRNDGNNDQEADYILVYGVRDYTSPKDYNVLAVFSNDKRLYSRGDRQARAAIGP